MSQGAEAVAGRNGRPAGEDEAIARIVAVERALMERTIADDGTGARGRPVVRAQHPKQHGAARASFVIRDDVPASLRRGLFAEPGRSFPAWIRFSNAGQRDDRDGGGHGMAIKLMDVPGARNPDGSPGSTHDFVLLDFPRFFVKDAIDFAQLAEARLDAATRGSIFAKLPMALFVLVHPRFAGGLIRIRRQVPVNPLAATYWSTTPYALGDDAEVKYLVRPLLDGPAVAAEQPSPDQLREAMARHLDQRPARFEFLVQLRVDPEAQPIEDASVEWDEEEFPPTPVATIEIAARQPFEEWMNFCENLAFSPWRGHPDHQPLGGINRVRARVYAELSALRRERNGVHDVEPTPETDPARAPEPAADEADL